VLRLVFVNDDPRFLMEMKLEKSWYEKLPEELNAPYFKKLREFLAQEIQDQRVVYPPPPLIFNAFRHTSWDLTKVVIVGQDPYHGPGQANGLSFSVPCGIPVPPSLKNIYLELHDDLGIPPAKEGCLSSWAKQGVLLLNATLTVRSAEPKSHYGKGWERFTDAVVSLLLQREDPLVFLLWGKSAQEKWKSVFQNKKTPHAALMAPHPSPLSAYQGFLGCRHFSKTNELLKKWGKAPIDWRLG
jgi:uracil-DNA glycosylase